MSSKPQGLADYLRNHEHPGGIIVHPATRTIYMKPCKTAGTAILRKTLQPRVPGFVLKKDTPQEFSAWLNALTDDDLADYFIFSVIRNPWDRLSSNATYFGQSLADLVENFDRYRTQDPVLREHVLPLTNYTHLDGKPFCDLIVRFENLEQELQPVFARFGLSVDQMERANASQKSHYSAHYDDKLIAWVGERYRSDIESFGYEFEAHGAAPSTYHGGSLFGSKQPIRAKAKSLLPRLRDTVRASLPGKIFLRAKRKYWFLRYRLSAKPEMPFDNCFVIGSNKTGTTSCARFLRKCGMRHLTINRYVQALQEAGRMDRLKKITGYVNSFDDIPWNRLEVIEAFMKEDRDHRFILTVRDPDAWFESFLKHEIRRGNRPKIEERREEFIRQNLLAHNRKCHELARKHEKKLLEIDVTTDPHAGSKIAEFLDLDIEPIPSFPHANAANRKSRLDR